MRCMCAGRGVRGAAGWHRPRCGAAPHGCCRHVAVHGGRMAPTYSSGCGQCWCCGYRVGRRVACLACGRMRPAPGGCRVCAHHTLWAPAQPSAPARRVAGAVRRPRACGRQPCRGLGGDAPEPGLWAHRCVRAHTGVCVRACVCAQVRVCVCARAHRQKCCAGAHTWRAVYARCGVGPAPLVPWHTHGATPT